MSSTAIAAGIYVEVDFPFSKSAAYKMFLQMARPGVLCSIVCCFGEDAHFIALLMAGDSKRMQKVTSRGDADEWGCGSFPRLHTP